MKLFNSKYPIICAPMNQVSDSKLAIAAHEAGIIPSLTIPYTTKNLKKCIDTVEEELIKFRSHVVDSDLILAFSSKLLIPRVIKLIVDHKVSHIELLEVVEERQVPIIKLLRENGIKTIMKLVYFTKEKMAVGKYDDILLQFDALDLKSGDAASRVKNNNESLMHRYLMAREKYPMMPIIVTGGISTSSEIKQYLDVGATAVGLGTVFALSEESCINHKKKLALLELSYSDVKQIKAGNMDQNAIVFSHSKIIDKTDTNNTGDLILGRDSADKGLIFVGKGIDNVNAIKPVAQIVEELTKDV